MSVTLKKDSWKIKDGNGTYRESAIFSTTLPEDAAAVVAEATSAIDAQQIRATDIVDTATSSIDDIIAAVNSVVETGTDTTLTQSGAAADAKVTGDEIGELKSAFSSEIDALNGTSDNVVPTTVSNWTQIGTTGVYAKTDNGDLLLYGTSSANRFYTCFNATPEVKNTSDAFDETFPAGTYKLNISTESTVASLGYVLYTYTKFNTTTTWRIGDTISPTAAIMVGMRITNGVNYGTSESPTRISISITSYKEKADRSYVDGELSDVETALAGKQSTLTFDNYPKTSSNNPVKSDGIKHDLNYLTDNINGETVAFGIVDSATNVGITASQDGNRITLNGESTATSSQAASKILICDHIQLYNSSTVPDGVKVYPIKTIVGHKYNLSVKVISGTRTPDVEGANRNIRLQAIGLVDSVRTVLCDVYLRTASNFSEHNFVCTAESIQLMLLAGRLQTMTDLVLEVNLRDVTYETANEIIDNQLALKTESIISHYTLNEYWSNSGTASVVETESAYNRFDAIPVNPMDRVIVKIYSGNSSSQSPVLVVDENNVILESYIGTRNTWNTFDIEVRTGASKLLLTTTTTSNAIKTECKKVVGYREKTSFDGCKMSLLGDSFSAIEAYCAHNYYPNVNSDVYSGEQMWWKIVADQMGMTPLVIGGWSGSCVTDGIRDGYTPASDPARCEALGIDDVNPDVVFIAMGVNDYSYMSTESQFGTWDGTTALGSESDLSDYDTNTFKTAYATMLARIQRAYPNAFIVCITPWYTGRRTTNTGANYLNEIGKDVKAYADAIKEIAEIMHCPVIDGTNIGFNRRNYYPTYCIDSSSYPTHPNIAGQAQIAKAITEQLKTLHRLGT